MNSVACPTAERWQQHLRGTLPADADAELAAHLDGCPACQKMLETLTAQGDSLLEVARAVGQEPATQETALKAALGAMRADTDGAHTQGWTDGEAAEFPYLDAPAEPGQIGRLGPYRVLEVIGRGGMGVVFKALDEKLQRVVAIKVLGQQFAASESARQRFEREARSAAAVSHDHIVPIYHVGEHGGVAFLVMPLIVGRSLQDRIEKEGPLELNDLLRIGAQIANGLAAAHKQGLVHRDIKPANILLENDGERVKITDFGLARAVDDASLTQSGVVTGTPMYMSPEQARGEQSVDARSDLFSLGSVLYAMATGGPPFRASGSMGVLKRVCEEAPTPMRAANPQVPEWLEAIVAKMHAKNPDDRFQSAQEVADLLGQHIAHLQEPHRTPRPAPVQPPAPMPPRTPVGRSNAPWLFAGIGCVVLFGISVVGIPVVIVLGGILAWLTPIAHEGAAGPQAHMAADPMPDDAQADPMEPGWVQLFNGHDLDGWKTHPEQPGNWRVEAGLLVGSGPPGILLTEDENLVDCRFRIEAKVIGETDAGQLVRCGTDLKQKADTLRKKPFTYPSGYLAPIFCVEGGRHDLLGFPSLPAGVQPRFEAGLNLESGRLKDANSWFRREIFVRGHDIQVKCGNQIIGEYRDDQRLFKLGHLGLQLIGGEIRIRRIEVMELPPEPAVKLAPP